MHLIFLGCLGLIFSLTLDAGVSYKKAQSKEFEEKSKLKDSVKSITGASSENDLAQVNARLRIEGAKFRSFNLFFPPLVVNNLASAEEKKLAGNLRNIIERDLAISGGINFVQAGASPKNSEDDVLKQKGVEGRSSLMLNLTNDRIDATIKHKNLITSKRSSKSFSGKTKDIRKIAHQISQSVFEEFIGPESLFTLQIAAVKRSSNGSQIVMMDFDGSNEVPLSSSPAIKTSPYFSPNGKSILYTEVGRNGQRIVEQTIGKKILLQRTKKEGLNLDARVMPDNSALLATLSFQGSAAIYKAKRDGTVLSKVTDSLGLNLSPSISPKGDLLAFVSTRSGTPQIFLQKLVSGLRKAPATRLTFKGNYNQTPNFSPDGNLIAFTGRDENKVFDLFLVEPSSGRVSRITENQGRNQEPFFTPSGRYVIFSSERDGISDPGLFIATLNGNHQHRLTSNGAYLSPVVRPRQ